MPTPTSIQQLSKNLACGAPSTPDTPLGHHPHLQSRMQPRECACSVWSPHLAVQWGQAAGAGRRSSWGTAAQGRRCSWCTVAQGLNMTQRTWGDDGVHRALAVAPLHARCEQTLQPGVGLRGMAVPPGDGGIRALSKQQADAGAGVGVGAGAALPAQAPPGDGGIRALLSWLVFVGTRGRATAASGVRVPAPRQGA